MKLVPCASAGPGASFEAPATTCLLSQTGGYACNPPLRSSTSHRPWPLGLRQQQHHGSGHHRTKLWRGSENSFGFELRRPSNTSGATPFSCTVSLFESHLAKTMRFYCQLKKKNPGLMHINTCPSADLYQKQRLGPPTSRILV